MVNFSNAVPAPNYAAPAVNFDWVGNLANNFRKGQQNQPQTPQPNQQKNALNTMFPNGVPTDANGNPNYRAIASVLGQIGNGSSIGANQMTAVPQNVANFF